MRFWLQAQRLLSAGQIDQEVDIDNGGATKKHKVRPALRHEGAGATCIEIHRPFLPMTPLASCA
jgi:hypothetical protein